MGPRKGHDKGYYKREYCKEKVKSKCKQSASIRKGPRNMQNKTKNMKIPIVMQMQEQLRSYEKEEAARIRAKTQYFLEGEKCSKYFFALEKNRRKVTLMISIRTDDGRLLEDQQEIQAEVRNFYHYLYEEESIEEPALDEMLEKIKRRFHQKLR